MIEGGGDFFLIQISLTIYGQGCLNQNLINWSKWGPILCSEYDVKYKTVHNNGGNAVLSAHSFATIIVHTLILDISYLTVTISEQRIRKKNQV